jgi:hypothetical protein
MGGEKPVALPHDVEVAKRRMEQAQKALLQYVEGEASDPERHKRLIQEARSSTSRFINLMDGLAAGKRPR